MDGDVRETNDRAGHALERDLLASARALDLPGLRLDYWRHDELAIVPDFLSGALLARIASEVRGLHGRVKRRSVWGYKAAGSLACHTLAVGAPTVMALYRSRVLRSLLSSLAERSLQPCPAVDPHSAAVYWYEQPGDRVGFHYDVSHYRGARYTVLLGIEDESSARLQCRVRSRERRRDALQLDVRTTPGKLVFFNGDKLLHAVSPIAAGERRIVLSLQYVTDTRMYPARRAISLLKDSLTYFGMDAFRVRARP